MPLALAGKTSATSTICSDMEMVDDLLSTQVKLILLGYLGRNISIQYNYYDANGDFFSSFIING